MTIQAKILGAIAVSGLAALAMTSQANALTAQECSAKYQAAKTAGTLGGQKWNDFRKAQCGADATAAPRPPLPLQRLRPPRRRKPPRKKPGRKPRRLRRPPHRQAPRSIRTPSIRNIPRRPPARRACTPAWISTTPTRPANANGGLKWIQKGGGYYSECTKKLKGAA